MGLLTGRYRKNAPRPDNARMQWVSRHLTDESKAVQANLAEVKPGRDVVVRDIHKLAAPRGHRTAQARLGPDRTRLGNLRDHPTRYDQRPRQPRVRDLGSGNRRGPQAARENRLSAPAREAGRAAPHSCARWWPGATPRRCEGSALLPTRGRLERPHAARADPAAAAGFGEDVCSGAIGADDELTQPDELRSRWPPARPSHPDRGSSRPAQGPGGTPPDKAWAQRHPSRPPHRASQFRCHPIVRQTPLCHYLMRILVTPHRKQQPIKSHQGRQKGGSAMAPLRRLATDTAGVACGDFQHRSPPHRGSIQFQPTAMTDS